ncbi:MAG: PAS domain S-box protein [Acidobacteria bacterium]|nr:MAG: PAS domain S-box protein [Acidobacteriota bacterium]
MSSEPLSDAQLRLSALVASSDAAIISKDLAGTITSWNRAAERIFGYTESEAVGQSIRLIVPPELFSEEDEVLLRVRGGEGVDHYETVRLRQDGRRIDVSVTVSPITRLDGTIVGVSRIARDITHTKHLERDARHFAAIVESSDDAIISKDLDGTIRSWNRSAEVLFGYAAAEVIGRSIRIIVPPDRESEEDHVLSSVRRGEIVDHFETLRLRKDGTLVPISLTVSPIRAASGEIVGASTIARDLSRTQRAQRDALRLAAIVDSSDDAIVSKDLNGIVTSWNTAAEEIFGFSADEMIGQSIRLLIPDDRQQEENEVLAKIRRGERVEHYETIRRRKDGALVPISLTVSPIRSEDGTVIGASKIARDISELERAEIERRRMLGIAQDASRLKDEFLATLSHELRTPLNAIVGYLRMMQAGLITGEKQSRAMDTVVRNAASLTQIVEDVLDVSRIISGKLRLNVQSVELAEIIEEAVETIRPEEEAKGIRIETIVDPRTGPVSGDPERLRQILWNLCSNAVKFTQRGGRVQVRLERVNSHIEVSVSDTGIGISAEFLPHLFERFRQADAGFNRAAGGLGLGLAISRHLVELQGGRIFAESEGLGKGSTFRVELPVRTAYATSSSETREHPHAPLVGGHLEVPQLQGVRILVVDDDRDALALVREILEATGATVATASSGQEALDKLQRAKADVLIADLGMPTMTGFELIDRVRRFENVEIRDIPAAALTAFARSEDRAKALRSGFELHLAKPIDPGELMAAAAALARRATLSG